MTSSHAMRYRPDIDGLRSIAVLLVIGFHAFPVWVKCGFIGVDVFFVISGYLISGIIFSNIENNTFSFANFYTARIRRIFPALILAITISLMFGWFYLLADEFAELGKQILFGSIFLSNFLYWSESGYFGGEAISKPMLHLWSLAIEEQFYILWPLLLYTFWHRARVHIQILFALMIAISFSINIYLSYTNPSAAYFWSITRFWELIVGGSLSYAMRGTVNKDYENNGAKEYLSIFGIFLLLLSFIFINAERKFPGFWAILPTFAALLIIASGPNAAFNRIILSSKALVFIGKISYPLYLWHWIILSLLSTVDNIASRNTRIGAIAISFFLATLTYFLVERPIRFRLKKPPTLVLLSSLTVIGLTGFLIWKSSGFEGIGVRSVEKTEYAKYFHKNTGNAISTIANVKLERTCDFYNIESEQSGFITRRPVEHISTDCLRTATSNHKTVFLWGDSHAAQLYSALDESIPKTWGILQLTSSGCTPVIDASDSSVDYCEHSNWLAFKTISEERPAVVIIAQLRGHNAGQMDKIGRSLRAVGVLNVIFIGPTPHWEKPLYKIVLRNLWENTPERTFVGLDRDVLASDETLSKTFIAEPGMQYVSIINRFCNKTLGCLVYLHNDRMKYITTADSHHLSSSAAQYFVKNDLLPIFKSLDN